MIKRALAAAAIALGLAAVPPATDRAVEIATAPARAIAWTPRSRGRRRRARRCPLCGTGGHARTSKHARRTT